jgi:hypothetical protein
LLDDVTADETCAANNQKAFVSEVHVGRHNLSVLNAVVLAELYQQSSALNTTVDTLFGPQVLSLAEGPSFRQCTEPNEGILRCRRRPG